jgi:hypothetical protein
MEEGLKIKIGADVSGLEKGVKQAEQSMARLKPATNQAAFALQNLGRIASDAPFGFIAIQNNLDPLLQSFSALKVQTGSTGAAFKSLFASLAGPAGIALAFSVISSAVTSLIQKYGSLGNALSNLLNSNDKYFQQQQEILKIQKEGVKQAGDEIAKLTLLNAIAKDTSNALDVRTRAVQELRKEFPTYLKGISDEAILSNQATDAINKTTAAILNKSLAIAAEKKLAEVGALLLQNQLDQVEAVKQYETASKLNRAANEKALKQGLQGIQGVNTETVAYNTQLDKTKTRLQDLGTENAKLEEQFKRITDLGKAFAGKAGISFFKPEKESVTKGLKIDPIEIPVRLIPDKATVSDSDASDRRILEQFKIANGIQVPIKLSVPQETFDKLKQFGEAAKNALEIDQLKAKAAEFKAILNQGLAQPLGDLIFNFLDQGKVGFKEFADTAIASIKRIVAQIIASEIIQLLGNALTGGGSGAVGGIFSALSGIFGGVAAPNVGGLGQQGFNLAGQVVFTQRGTDLVGVLNAGNGQIRRTG